MNKRDKVRKFVKDNDVEILVAAYSVFIIAAALTVYTLECDLLGYRMMKLVSVNDNYVYSETISGKKLRSPILTPTT